jgi:hypothetical protein
MSRKLMIAVGAYTTQFFPGKPFIKYYRWNNIQFIQKRFYNWETNSAIQWMHFKIPSPSLQLK